MTQQNVLPQTPWPTHEFSNFEQPNTAVPIYFDPFSGRVAAKLNNSAFGELVTAEIQEGTGTIYTVPESDTLTGFAVLMVAGASGGTGTISAATGGALVKQTYEGGAITPVVVPITVAGGESGNAISVADASSGVIVSASVVGYLS